ncbi:hypothetical protein [Cellulosilyticum sp. I15G10I2]|nr:hypothetical protein [Cellulosilyticum sp. I15G10I2]
MIQVFIRYDVKDKADAERIKKGLAKMNFTKHLEEKDTDQVNREIWARE